MSSASSSARRFAGYLSAESIQLLLSNRSNIRTLSTAALTGLEQTRVDSSVLPSSNLTPSHGSFSEHKSNHTAFRLIQSSTLCGGTSNQISQRPAQQTPFHVRSMFTGPSSRSAVYRPLLSKQYSSESAGSPAASSTQPTSSASVTPTIPSTEAISNKNKSESPVPSSEGGAAPNPWINTPNLLSMGRAVSGPIIAYLIMEDQWVIAISALAVSGATDWLDGYMARKLNQSSVVGSYLDPLADKVLIGSVAIALAAKALMPWWIAAAIVGRDVGLVGGMFIHRAHMLGWRWPGASVFFSTQDVPAASKAHSLHNPGAEEAKHASTGHASTHSAAPRRDDTLDLDTGSIAAFFEKQSGQHAGGSGIGDGTGSKSSSTTEGFVGGNQSSGSSSSSDGNSSTGKAGAGDGGVPYMKPLLISKVNTVFQLALVGAYICKAQVGWPDDQALHLMVVLTVSTTIWTCVRYAHKYYTGRLFQQTL